MVSQGREAEEDMSPTNAAVLSLVQFYCQMFQHHKKHHANTLKLVLGIVSLLGKKGFQGVFIPRLRRWEGIHSAQGKDP